MDSTPSDTPRSSPAWGKIGLFALLVLGIGVGYCFLRDKLSLDYLAAQEAQLRQFGERNPVLVYGVAFGVYVLITGLSLPGAAPMTLVIGWIAHLLHGNIGLVYGILLVSCASTTGATLAFLMSRYLLRDSIRSKFGERLKRFEDQLEKEGAFYLFTLRLIPAVPFFVINVVMGLTPIRTLTYWWVSQLGMFPGTCVFVYAGWSVPDLQTLSERGLKGILTPQIIIAFVLLGLFPLVVRKLMAWLRPEALPQNNTTEATDTSTVEEPYE